VKDDRLPWKVTEGKNIISGKRVFTSQTGDIEILKTIKIKDMEIYTIRRKAMFITVTPFLVKDLDISKCSNMFRQRTYSLNDTVYVKCDEEGNIVWRQRKNQDQYTLLGTEYYIYNKRTV